MRILCSISTKNRYDILPMAIMSVVQQRRKPDHLTIFDDNDNPTDIREIQQCAYMLRMLDVVHIPWNLIYGPKKGQHYNHQMANMSGFDAVWRLDDDCYAEPDTLGILEKQMVNGVGAVGGSILTPPLPPEGMVHDLSSSIDHLDKPNKQWWYVRKTEEVDHLNCSFLYRAGVANYDLRLSRKAHREETMFTYGLKLKGYKILITPCVTWHFKSQTGGIRSDNDIADYQRDEWIFNKWLEFKKTGKKLYVLAGGLGDHYMFLQAVRLKPNAVIACCYPDLFKGYDTISIADAYNLVNVDEYNIYGWCVTNKWQGTLVEAFRKMYEG